MKVVGYAEIRKDATSGMSAVSLEKFKGKVCRVFEFTPEGDVLVIDSEATGLATFDAKDVLRKFECQEVGEVIAPKEMNLLEATIYSAKCMSRKGGYNQLLRQMVVMASIAKGKFTDSFLWSSQ